MLEELDVDEDPGPPTQAPALSWSEEKRLRARLAWQEKLEWLMLPEADERDPELLLRSLIDRPEWHERAACRGMGTEIFFPERGQSSKPATDVCERCDVREQCLRASLAGAPSVRLGMQREREYHGIWGGLSERGRRVLLRRRAA